MAFSFKGFRATKPVARLIDPVKGNYEVFFLVYDGVGKRKPVRFSQGINCLPKYQRRTHANAMAQVLWDALHEGWNPTRDKYPRWKEELAEPDTPLTFDQALDFAMHKKRPNLSRWSIYDYDGCVRFIKAAAKETGYHTTDIRQIKRKDIRLIVATAKENNSWSNNARNKYLTILQGLLTTLVDEERIEYNPAHKIKSEPVNEGMGFRPATDEEKERIATQLMEKAPDFFDFIMFIYQSGIRRTELLSIQLKDISLQRREIIIRPEVAKTNKKRIIPVPDDIYEILMARETYKLPQQWYLFSSDEFKPGEFQFSPNTPTKWWRKMIINSTTGLGIDVKLYGMKHTGGDDKIRAGMELDVLKTLYGHRSKQMTENYAKAVREQYSQQIKDKSPAFAKVVQLNRKAK